jgi:hypothetical protein
MAQQEQERGPKCTLSKCGMLAATTLCAGSSYGASQTDAPLAKAVLIVIAVISGVACWCCGMADERAEQRRDMDEEDNGYHPSPG